MPLKCILASVFLSVTLWTSGSMYGQQGVQYIGTALWSEIRDIATDGQYAYCAMAAGLQIVDCSRPPELEVASRLFFDDGAQSIAFDGSYVYLGLATNGIAVIDVFDVQRPEVVAQIPTSSWIDGLDYADANLCASHNVPGEYRASLMAIDVREPENPSVLSEISSPELIGNTRSRVKMQGSHAYVATVDLWIVDLSSPSEPVPVAVVETPFIATDVDADETHVFVADDSDNSPAIASALVVVDVSNPIVPAIDTTYIYYGSARMLRLQGDRVYLAAEDIGLAVFDVSDPGNPAPIWCHKTDLNAVAVAADGPHVLLGQKFKSRHGYEWEGNRICDSSATNESTLDSGAVLLFDMNGSSGPELEGSLTNPEYCIGVAMQDDFAYVAGLFGRMTILGVSSPEEPIAVSSVSLPPNPLAYELRVRAHGDSVFVAQGEAGLAVIDVSDKSNPRLAAVYNSSGWAADIAFDGEYAYYAAGYAGLQIFDMSRPYSPVIVATVPTPDWAIVVQVQGDYAYVGARFAGLQIINIANPLQPRVIAHFPDSGAFLAHSLAVGDGFAAIGSGGRSFQLVDISDPYRPLDLGRVSTSGSVWNLAAEDRRLFSMNAEGGWEQFEISDHDSVSMISDFRTPGLALGVSISENLLCVADQTSVILYTLGNKTTPPPIPTHAHLYPNYPNPFNTSTVIEYDISEACRVKLSIYNVLGQEVTTLVDSYREPSHYTIPWDGTNVTGDKVASGVYLLRLVAGTHTSDRKMILLK
jgi:hypothetical protein